MIFLTPKAIIALGTFLGVLSLVRLQVITRAAQTADAAGTEALLSHHGFATETVGPKHLMIVGFQYVINRRRYAGISCTGFETRRGQLTLWFLLFSAGVVVAGFGFFARLAT